MGVYKRGDTWCIRFKYRGKDIRKAVSTSKKEAQLALGKVKAQIAENKFRLKKKSSPLLSSFAADYLEYCKSHHSLKTYRDVDKIAIKNFIDAIGDVEIGSIQPYQIEKYKTERLQAIGKSSVNRRLNVIRAMFNRAKEWGLIEKNPLDHIKKYTEDKKPPRFLAKDEVRELLRLAQGKLREILVVLLNTGLRKGELENLRWDDVDLENGFILIRESKTNDYRRVPINSSVHQLLASKKNKTGYVFGKQNNLLRNLKNLYKKAGIEDAHIHTLRHTCASFMAQSGVPLFTIAKILGHKSLKTTEIYSHLTTDDLKKAVDTLKLTC